MPSPANSGQHDADLRFLQLSPSARYALRGARAVAAAWGSPKRFMLAGEAAKREGLPANFLSKIFQKLARCGVLISQRGPGGGYALARPPAQVTLAEVVRAAHGDEHEARPCLLRRVRCGENGTCLIHAEASGADRRLGEILQAMTLADMIEGGGA